MPLGWAFGVKTAVDSYPALDGVVLRPGAGVSRRPAPSARLSERDRALLEDVARLRLVSGGQLARLYFFEGTPVGRQRRAQAALRRLTDDGYLDRLPRRIGGPGSGSSRFVYQLGYRGQREVRPGARARTPEVSGYPFVCHAVAVAEVVVRLVEAERAGRCRELKIETEPGVWRRYLGSHGQAVVLKPDLGLQIVVSAKRLAWFIEVDRSTESLKRISHKARQYLTYWQSGQEQARLGGFPRVLWSVPDQRRAEGMRRTLGELPEPASAMFTVCLAEAVTKTVLGEQHSGERGDEEQQQEGGER